MNMKVSQDVNIDSLDLPRGNNLEESFEIIPGKVLLFGEYSILFKSQGLIIPYKGFSGKLQLNGFETESHKIIKDLTTYLEENCQNIIDLKKLNEDISRGLFFASTIPMGQGMGSSAAVTAALIKSYGLHIDKMTNIELKKNLGLIESYFHGKSSGFDPLVCCLNNSLLKTSMGTVESIALPNTDRELRVFLVPTGEERKGAKVIASFMNKMENEPFLSDYTNKYIPLNDLCIDSFLNQSPMLSSQFEQLSQMQYQIFEDSMTPYIKRMWLNGLESKDFFMKLCGAGGGGFYLAFGFNKTFIPNEDWIELILKDIG